MEDLSITASSFSHFILYLTSWKKDTNNTCSTAYLQTNALIYESSGAQNCSRTGEKQAGSYGPAFVFQDTDNLRSVIPTDNPFYLELKFISPRSPEPSLLQGCPHVLFSRGEQLAQSPFLPEAFC